MKKVTKVMQVKEMLLADPSIKAESVAEKLGINKTYAYTLISTAKCALRKKRGRPLGVKNKPKTDINALEKHISELEKALVQKSQRVGQLELILQEKEKEVWTLECEVFDKKAIIKYLEEKRQ